MAKKTKRGPAAALKAWETKRAKKNQLQQPEKKLEKKGDISIDVTVFATAKSLRGRLIDVKKQKQNAINAFDAEIEKINGQINEYKIFIEKEKIIIENAI